LSTPVVKLAAMKRTCLLVIALLLASVAHAEQSNKTQYVTDQITLGLHQKPSNNAGTIGVVKSGDRVTVLRSLGENSFAQVKTSDGREGWVVTRNLSDQPAARDQLDDVNKQLNDAQAQIKALQSKLYADQQQLTNVKPALDLAAENDKLRAGIAQRDEQLKGMEQHYNIASAHRDTLITGAALAIGGVILGLLLPWLSRGRKRRYSDL